MEKETVEMNKKIFKTKLQIYVCDHINSKNEFDPYGVYSNNGMQKTN